MPNPSIERTSPGKPGAASHLKRLALVELLYALLVGLLFIFCVLYVTWLFLHRLRSREGKVKSFLKWVRDLFDAANGLG
jgi:NhaP-type Na+/H+ or K+/H+ antiporter